MSGGEATADAALRKCWSAMGLVDDERERREKS
jgi:hypothetical protein